MTELPSPAAQRHLTELAEWAKTQLPQLIDDVHAAVLERIDLYRTQDLVSQDELRESIGDNLHFLITAIGEPQAPHDLSAPSQTGRRRAHQGVPLAEVLRFYQIGFATLWNALVRQTRAADRPDAMDALLDAATMVWQLTDEHALILTEAYRAATAKLLLAQHRRRAALVEALLTGQPGPQGGPWEAAKLLALSPNADLVVVVAETRGLAQESLAGIETSLAATGIVSAWRLSPTHQLGVVSLQDGQCDGLLSALRKAASTRVGVSPLYRALAGTPRALHLARVALAAIPSGRAEVRIFSSSPLAALMACEPDEGQRLAAQVLGPVLDLPDEDRSILLDTLEAYLDHAGSAERAAKVLYCHPNTVRYRLRRLHELTGRSLADPRGMAELAAAAYAIRIHDGAGQTSDSRGRPAAPPGWPDNDIPAPGLGHDIPGFDRAEQQG